MRNLVKKVRAIGVIGITWALAWGIIGAVVGAVEAIKIAGSNVNPQLSLGGMVSIVAAFFGVYGFIGGSFSGVILSIAERQRSLSELTVGRFALWGGIAGGAVPAVNILLVRLLEGGSYPGDAAIVTAICSGLGAISSAALLRIAQSGAPPAPDTSGALANQANAELYPRDIAPPLSAAKVEMRKDPERMSSEPRVGQRLRVE